MGVIIYPGQIGPKMNAMNTELDVLNESVVSINNKMNDILSNIGVGKKLTGNAWTNQRNHIQNVQLNILYGWQQWIMMQKSANQTYQQAGAELPSVGELNLEKLKRARDEYNRSIASLYSMMSSSTYLTSKGLGSQIRYYERELEKINEKIDAIEAFLGKTGGIYAGALATLNLIQTIEANFPNYIAVGNMEKMYQENKEVKDWKKEFATIYITKGMGVSEEEISNLAELGYSKVEIAELFKCTKSEEDIEFLKCMLTEDYKKAFDTDPRSLSDIITIIMADYANRLYSQGKNEELMKFTNAILGSSIREDMDPADYATDVAFICPTYCCGYLDKMYVGAKAIQMKSLIEVAAMDPEAAYYEEMKASYEEKWDMANFWATQAKYRSDQQWKSGSSMNAVKMIGFTKTKEKQIVFKMEYYDGKKGYVEDEITMDRKDTPSGYRNSENCLEMEELDKEANTIVAKTAFKIISNLGILGVSAVSPVAGFGLGALKGVATMSPGSVTGVDVFGQSDGAKLALNGGQEIMSGIADGLLEYYATKGEISAANYQHKMEYFGSCAESYYEDALGEKTTFLVNVDINNPDMVRAMYQYQAEGFGSITGWDVNFDLLKKDVATADNKGLSDKTKLLAGKILNKQYNLFDDSYINDQGEKVQVEFSDFEEAIKLIEVQADKDGGTVSDIFLLKAKGE